MTVVVRFVAALALALANQSLAQNRASRTDGCDRGGVLSPTGIGPLRIGMTIDSLARTCRIIDRRYISEYTTTRYPVRVGADTLTVWEANGHVGWIQTTSHTHRTRDSLGVGTSVARLLMLPDIDGGPGDGTDRYAVYAKTGEHCGLTFWLDGKTAEILGATKGDVTRALGMRGGNGFVVEVNVRGECQGRPELLSVQGVADTTQVRAFVKEFYAWYVPIAYRTTRREPAADVAMRDRSAAFTREFLSALREETAAQRRPGEDLGLNFDPILLSQDPCDRYDVGAINRVGAAYRVELIPFCGGVRSPYQDGVLAEVSLSEGAWRFSNFHGPKDKMDVMKHLDGWRASRAQMYRPAQAPLATQATGSTVELIAIRNVLGRYRVGQLIVDSLFVSPDQAPPTRTTVRRPAARQHILIDSVRVLQSGEGRDTLTVRASAPLIKGRTVTISVTVDGRLSSNPRSHFYETVAFVLEFDGIRWVIRSRTQLGIS